MASHEEFIHRCFELASKGLGTASPNPLVGSVIVHDGLIIGEGYHHKAGQAHAEVNAIASVANKSLLPSSTIYVNLEPCCHTGLTPPCSELVIKHKIPNVVVCNLDPNPRVNGGGISMLTEAGVNVTKGILEAEGRELNRRFFTVQEKKRPYVILKWAQSQDGFMDIDRETDQKGIHWISSPETKKLVHIWRSQEDAILVGRKTVLTDDPELTVREVEGSNPTRIVLDRKLKIPGDARIFNNEANTIIVHSNDISAANDRDCIAIDFDQLVPKLLEELGKRQISSLIVEGGRMTLQSFIDSGIWDEARIITGQNNIQSGMKAPSIDGQLFQKDTFAGDTIEILRRK
jgi:diaminohydroxyphosphoribosylaminopyrimidine deaminase/5-amino-6-(5-phosphoribosylamino)uracil reductase